MSPDLGAAVGAAFSSLKTGPIGVAVSGGSDSIALLHLAVSWAGQAGLPVRAITINHGLRAEAAGEAAFVADVCRRMGVPHNTLAWTCWNGRGNLQDAARRARYRLIADWAQAHRLHCVALGHTLDDQAETLLMRLARGAGVDGLSAMPARWQEGSVTMLRPLLCARRQALRDYLSEKGQSWLDDPSNDDKRFDRVKAREALTLLAPMGIDADRLGQVAQNMASVRRSLEQLVSQAAERLAKVEAGALRLDWVECQDLPDEIMRRLLLRALRWISGSRYPPRSASLDAVMAALTDAGAATLDGCLMRRKDRFLWLSREYRQVQDQRAGFGDIWDGRWTMMGPTADPGMHIAVLGDAGLAGCPDWRETGLPRDVLRVTPAVWQGETLVAAPLVNPGTAWQAVLERGESAFFDAPITH